MPGLHKKHWPLSVPQKTRQVWRVLSEMMYGTAATENVALWHEKRDISPHQLSAITPDTTILIDPQAVLEILCQEFDGFPLKYDPQHELYYVWFDFWVVLYLTLIEKKGMTLCEQAYDLCEAKSSHSWDSQVDTNRFSRLESRSGLHATPHSEEIDEKSSTAYYTKQ